MNTIVTANNTLDKSISTLVLKVNQDLQYGVKIFGNEINHTDIIRVWTKSESNIFGVIASSGNRFDTNLNLLEIQSFKVKPYLKLSILLGDEQNIKHSAKVTKLNDNFLEMDDITNTKDAKLFIEDYLKSIPDKELTKINFEKYAYNPSQYEWINSSL